MLPFPVPFCFLFFLLLSLFPSTLPYSSPPFLLHPCLFPLPSLALSFLLTHLATALTFSHPLGCPLSSLHPFLSSCRPSNTLTCWVPVPPSSRPEQTRISGALQGPLASGSAPFYTLSSHFTPDLKNKAYKQSAGQRGVQMGETARAMHGILGSSQHWLQDVHVLFTGMPNTPLMESGSVGHRTE